MAVTPPPTGPSPAAGVAAGTLLAGRYRLNEQLASGGMAQVWRGTDEVLRRSVAVKILHQHLASDEKFVARFRQEAIAVARLSHPSIISVYDTCSDDGVEAIVMELVRGDTLRHRLDNDNVGPWVAANIAAQVAGALQVAHSAGLVHRDIKPANIMLSEDGRVKVGDFGIAKAAESADLTQEGAFIGTAKYLAPEQVEGTAVDGRTDLYSLGVVLFEMLCGRVPFEADGSSATALARLHQVPARPRNIRPGIPRELEAITMKLLARDPDQRYGTAAEARMALLNAGADEVPVGSDVPTAATPTALPPIPPAGPASREQTQVRFADTERNWLLPTLLVILVAVSLVVAYLLLRNSDNSFLGDGGGQAEDEEQEPQPTGQPLGIAGAEAFDPSSENGGRGDGVEHADEIPAAIDGNADTTWSTEFYNEPDLVPYKDGVGMYVTLDQAATISRVDITTPSQGWSADIYVADSPAQSLDGWGSRVGQVADGTSGPNRIDLEEPTEGSAVLIWFTYVDPSAANDEGQHQAEVGEVQVFG